MTLPYSSATTGNAAVAEIQKILKGFGAGSCGVMEDFAAGIVTVQFEHRGRRVSIQASSKGYASAWLRENPYTNRTRGTRQDHEKRALERGQIAVYSILRDWIKGQVTAVEVGMFSFEGAFLGQLMLPTGETVLERLSGSEMLAPTRGASDA